MRLTRHLGGLPARRHRCLHACLTLLLAGAAASAHAVLITFDDLPPPDPEAGFASRPVTDEYASFGLIVNEGYLGGSGLPGTNQVLYGAPYLNLSFTGTLPRYVSLYVSAPNEDRVYVDATGPGGYARTFVTDGAGYPTSSPYRDNQYVSFYAASGISGLDLTAFYFLRTGPVIDNLYFGSVAPVPEPAPLLLAAFGALGLWGAARRLSPRSSAGRAGARPTR